MYENPYRSSLETKVLAATPLELVEIAFQAAVEAVAEARRHLAAGRIRERSRAISKCLGIMAELSRSLDRQAGGALSARLAALYHYISQQLLEGNFRQSDPPLAQAESLLRTLHEGWAGAVAAQAVTASAALGGYTGAHHWSA